MGSSHADKEDEDVSDLISSFLDGELSKVELNRLIKTFKEKSEFRQKLNRYILVGDVIKQRENKFSRVDISVDVREKIANKELNNKKVGRRLFAGLGIMHLLGDGWGNAMKHMALASIIAVLVVILGNVDMSEIGRFDISFLDKSNLKREMIDSSTEKNVEREEIFSQFAPMESVNKMFEVLAGSRSAQSQDDGVLTEQLFNNEMQLSQEIQEHFDTHLMQHAVRSAFVEQNGWMSFARLSIIYFR